MGTFLVPSFSLLLGSPPRKRRWSPAPERGRPDSRSSCGCFKEHNLGQSTSFQEMDKKKDIFFVAVAKLLMNADEVPEKGYSSSPPQYVIFMH